MARLRYNVATTLDGYIASPDGSTDWIVEDSSMLPSLYAQFDAFVMGRKTYEVMMSYASQSGQNPLEGRKVLVVSREMQAPDHPDITIVSEKPLEVIRRLKSEHEKDIWLMGGGMLARDCLEAGLLDTVETAIMPAMIGSGVKLIAGLTGSKSSANWGLALRGTDKLDSGIIMCRYDIAKSS